MIQWAKGVVDASDSVSRTRSLLAGGARGYHSQGRNLMSAGKELGGGRGSPRRDAPWSWSYAGGRSSHAWFLGATSRSTCDCKMSTRSRMITLSSVVKLTAADAKVATSALSA
jgi:hypothetical protein